MYNFISIHNNILEDLSKLDLCSNFILTNVQLEYAKNTNQKIIKPYVGFTNDKKEFIDIREHVLDKLTKYKIIGVKAERYGKINGMNYYPSGCAYSYTDNYFYIVFVNIHGDTYGNIFLEHRYQEKHQRQFNQTKFIPHDFYLELFIKPFAVSPSSCWSYGFKKLYEFY